MIPISKEETCVVAPSVTLSITSAKPLVAPFKSEKVTSSSMKESSTITPLSEPSSVNATSVPGSTVQV